MRDGAVSWAGLASSAPEEATEFYRALVGWERSHIAGLGEAGVNVMRAAGDEVALIYAQTREARRASAAPHWTCFISVENADATCAELEPLGGSTVFREPFDAGELGRIAAIRDPAGSLLSLWQPNLRVGPEIATRQGCLCWIELETPAPEVLGSFYRHLLGWAASEPEGESIQLERRGVALGSIRRPRGTAPWVPGQWIPYFGVRSCKAAVERAVALGGRPGGAVELPLGRGVLLADREGAGFGLVEVAR